MKNFMHAGASSMTLEDPLTMGIDPGSDIDMSTSNCMPDGIDNGSDTCICRAS